MDDFLDGCNDKHVSVTDFMDTFCRRCRNQECNHAGWAQDRFSTRIATQEERFFNPTQADPRLPQYAQILASEFPDMFRQAMALDVADQKGDWEIPEIPILDGVPDIATLTKTLEVDDAVKVLAAARGQEGPDLPPPTSPEKAPVEPPVPPPESTPPPQVQEPSAPLQNPLTPPPTEEMVSVAMTLPKGNTDVSSGGLMVDGSAPPSLVKEEDPWAVPAKKVVKIPVGGKVVMGGEPEGT